MAYFPHAGWRDLTAVLQSPRTLYLRHRLERPQPLCTHVRDLRQTTGGNYASQVRGFTDHRRRHVRELARSSSRIAGRTHRPSTRPTDGHTAAARPPPTPTAPCSGPPPTDGYRLDRQPSDRCSLRISAQSSTLITPSLWPRGVKIQSASGGQYWVSIDRCRSGRRRGDARPLPRPVQSSLADPRADLGPAAAGTTRARRPAQSPRNAGSQALAGLAGVAAHEDPGRRRRNRGLGWGDRLQRRQRTCRGRGRVRQAAPEPCNSPTCRRARTRSSR